MVAVRPFIPDSITVHLGSPSSNAQNVTVSFVDYIKNVASSEIYPTWSDAAIRANVLAQVSFALNRIYTEFYTSRGYAFNITNSTAYDQAFVNGRNFFSNISRIVDEFFNDYIRRIGFLEPLAAKYCNGTTVTCDGLSQWGSEELASRGYSYTDILYYYYGGNIEIVYNAAVEGARESYPGTALREGSRGSDVAYMQMAINRISQNYPAIPKIYPVDGIFGPQTSSAVVKLQGIFNLTPDGVIGKATWYEVIRLYVGILGLAELNSLGQVFVGDSWGYPDAITEGDTGQKVRLLQYMLSVISEFNSSIPPLTVSGTFDAATKNAVIAFQRMEGLPETGQVGAVTWDAIYEAYAGIAETTLSRGELFPVQGTVAPARNVGEFRSQLQAYSRTRPDMAPPPQNGRQDAAMSRAIRRFQNDNGLASTGRINTSTRDRMAFLSSQMQFAKTTRFAQYPGFELGLGMQDENGGAGNA